ncbi:PaaI family thioesterase [Planktotalea sp.]|uniref:PaaI family thioesterase n=1 Tax=Planktotalea sp. TaxID=2029877 RepID=UPI003F6B95BA
MELKMDVEALNDLMRSEFSQVANDFVVQSVAPMEAIVRMPVNEEHLRPGGTISGPTMFALADVSMYLVVLAMIGPVTLAVTTNCSIDFMRKPTAGVDLIAQARIHKLGRSLAVGDVLIHSEGMDMPVARASLTYAIPPR